jgi:glycosyltransferase involved in cell wall biosynthesis
MVSNQVLPDELPTFYRQAKVVYVPSSIYGGGERVVLEAQACGCRVEVEDDNPKLQELLVNLIPTYKDYAEKLKEGIQCVL